MSFRFTAVETSLNRAEFRWKWLRLLRLSFLLGTILCLALSLLGAAIRLGWLTNRVLANTCVAGLAVVGFISWVVILISVAADSPERTWLAAALERVDPRLLDRLNTLLFLERSGRDARAQAFAMRIAKQARALLAQRSPPTPFSGRPSLFSCILFLTALIGTILLYQLTAPWSHLVAPQKPNTALSASPEKPLDLALPATNNVEQTLAWGEVRITEPGTDMRVTKVDVVPLQIEAAANQELSKVSWFSTINGSAEADHELPPPSEPRYAVYQPTLFLDEMKLADWDVMTYYAKASTLKQETYASSVYFLEVRPFREDILKLPGGEGGKAYQLLNEMTSLISRQQHVIRQTHAHSQHPPEPANLRDQDRQKLAGAETDLSEAAQHLYAQMSMEMENQPIGEALDNLAKAQESLAHASRLLQSNALPEAQNRERSALAELVAARKVFQKAITDNPKAFEEPPETDPTPIADSAKKLSQIAEFRNEAKAAQDFVQKTLDQQKELEQQSRASRGSYPKLAEQERQLQQSLAEFQQQHPQAFNPVQKEANEAQNAMGKAADALKRRDNAAPNATQQAADQIRTLSQTMRNRTAGQELTDAYRLKELLDRQVQAFDQGAQPDSPLTDDHLRQTAREAAETVTQLKRAAEQEPTRQAFGDPLRNALSGESKNDLDTKLSQMERPQRLDQLRDRPNRQQRSADARDALAKVSKAFDQSQPQSLQMARQSDSLKAGEQDSLSQGMSELESLLQQLQSNHPASRENQSKQGRQALYDLQTGLRSIHGDNASGNQILLKLDQMLKAEQPLEVADLQKLLDALRHFSVETSEKMTRKEDHPQISNVDPARLPPAYRSRIQKYFQKLSEE